MTIFGTLSLGELIDLLSRRDPTQHVSFDFCGFAPTTLDSYRGYYDHLAIDYAPWGSGRVERGADKPTPQEPTVAVLITRLRAANGAVYHGWKGGAYTMGLDTPVWVSPRGECHGTAIVGIAECEYWTVLETRWVP